MFSKKLITIVSLVAILGLLLSACQQSATEPADATADPDAGGTDAGGLMCVIVPGVENPFFGTQQDIAVAKAEE
ncbi:MAG: D-ribose ABC transporter substrate-binding protein, partial [Anaerolineae bacterium]|nr:D-ribose ABC transporter substrate-binding protein [Anaerolineae bacterium]